MSSDVVHLLVCHKPSADQFSAFTHNHCLSCNPKLIREDVISYNAIKRLDHVVYLLIGCMLRSRMALFRCPAAVSELVLFFRPNSRKVSSETCNSQFAPFLSRMLNISLRAVC